MVGGRFYVLMICGDILTKARLSRVNIRLNRLAEVRDVSAFAILDASLPPGTLCCS